MLESTSVTCWRKHKRRSPAAQWGGQFQTQADEADAGICNTWLKLQSLGFVEITPVMSASRHLTENDRRLDVINSDPRVAYFLPTKALGEQGRREKHHCGL